jgi:hypothetical protein
MSECSQGPVSTLPGATWKVQDHDRCDQHPEVPAFKKVQGETDSFGCEYVFMCKPCYDAYIEYESKPKTGYCESHGGEGNDIRRVRDYEEGMCGRLYSVCFECRVKQLAAQAELYDDDDIDDRFEYDVDDSY